MIISITTFDDEGNEIISRDYKFDNENNPFGPTILANENDQILYDMFEDTKEYLDKEDE